MNISGIHFANRISKSKQITKPCKNQNCLSDSVSFGVHHINTKKTTDFNQALSEYLNVSPNNYNCLFYTNIKNNNEPIPPCEFNNYEEFIRIIDENLRKWGGIQGSLVYEQGIPYLGCYFYVRDNKSIIGTVKCKK